MFRDKMRRDGEGELGGGSAELLGNQAVHRECNVASASLIGLVQGIRIIFPMGVENKDCCMDLSKGGLQLV